MSLRDAAIRDAVLKVIIDEATATLAAAKDATQWLFDDTGATQTVAELPDGTKVATVSLARGGKSASVTNERAFLEWMIEHHPEEIVQSVRDNARKKILDEAKERGRPVDANGEIIPGITVGDSSKYVTVRFRDGGREAIVAAWRAGQLTGIELVAPPAIEGGEAA